MRAIILSIRLTEKCVCTDTYVYECIPAEAISRKMFKSNYTERSMLNLFEECKIELVMEFTAQVLPLCDGLL